MTNLSPLVSVIIPYYNARHWIHAAIESVLCQTYSNIEIIVVDDGSTDGDLNIVEAYLPRIELIQVPHSGANHARNMGFKASKGEFIQFLDADDYLLPEKIAHQVSFLQKTGADGVYGDWRHRYESDLKDGNFTFGEVKISGSHKDTLEALLSGWWVAPGALLYRRRAVEKSSGWDESLEAGQDRDFLMAVIMTGSDIGYQPGCCFVYRRYGNVTVSTSNKQVWLKSHCEVLDKAAARLKNEGRLTAEYRRALTRAYFLLARNYYCLDLNKFRLLIKTILELDPHFQPCESILYNSVQRLLGYEAAEKLANLKRRFL